MASPFPPNARLIFLKRSQNYYQESGTGNIKPNQGASITAEVYMSPQGASISVEDIGGINWTELSVKVFFVSPQLATEQMYGTESVRVEPLYPEKRNIPYGELFAINWAQSPWDAVWKALGTKITGQLRTEGGING